MDQATAEKLARVLLSLKVSIRRDDIRLRRNESNRINMLLVHAVAAMLIAPAFAASRHSMTGPNWEYLQKIPGFPYTFAAVFWVSGLILLPATLHRNRRWEIAGLALIGYWYLALSVGFMIPAVRFLYELLTHRHRAGGAEPSFYAWCVYMHLTVIMRVHIHTLWRMIHPAPAEQVDSDG